MRFTSQRHLRSFSCCSRILKSGRELAVLVRIQAEEGMLTSAIGRQIQALKPGQPVFQVEILKSITEEALGPGAALPRYLVNLPRVPRLRSRVLGFRQSCLMPWRGKPRRWVFVWRWGLTVIRSWLSFLVIGQGMRVLALGIGVGLAARPEQPD